MDKAEKTYSIWGLLTQRATVRRATRVSAIVGCILVTINQWEAITGSADFNIVKVLLTFMVPYCVSSYSAVMAHIEYQAERGGGEKR